MFLNGNVNHKMSLQTVKIKVCYFPSLGFILLGLLVTVVAGKKSNQWKTFTFKTCLC